MGAKQVSSWRVDISVSAKQMKNLVYVDWNSSSAKKTVGADKSSGTKQGKCNRCWASVKFSWCRVNP